MASSTTFLSDNCVYDNDGFVIRVKEVELGNTPQSVSSEPPYQNEFVSRQHGEESCLAGPSTGDENHTDLPERPVSRQSHYAGEKRRPPRHTRCPPPVKVRRYPYVLEGYPGLYTISQISRYSDVAPRRGTAMFLRRFYLVNEILDRTCAEGYKNRRIFPELRVGAEGDWDPKQSRWTSHGSSKLRNEILPADLVAEDDDSDEDFSFEPLSEHSFTSDLTNESLDFEEDFEAPMTTMSNAGDESDEAIFDFGNQNILDFGLTCTPSNLFCSITEDVTRSDCVLLPGGSNVHATSTCA